MVKKEVFAEKERREHGLPVNDNTMVELANLCGYLKLDFGKYFEGYELPKDSKFKLLIDEIRKYQGGQQKWIMQKNH